MRLVYGGAVREETDPHRIEKLLALGYESEGSEPAKANPVKEEPKKEKKEAPLEEAELFDVETLTNAEIIALLDKEGIKAPKSATKKDLLEIWRVHKG